ncbi:MAG: endonuclease/exonuclease/phosphatase family protein [Kiritimatiellia bacterium]
MYKKIITFLLVTSAFARFDFAVMAEPWLASEGEPLLQEAEVAFKDPSAGPIDQNGVRLAFYNIEMFTDGIKDGKYRNEELALTQARDAAGIIDELAADILVFSEIENARALRLLNESLAEPYPNGYVVTFGSGGSRVEKMNAAMLSRFAPESVNEIDFGPLTGPGRPTRGIFRAIFSLGEDRYLLLYAAHLKSNWGSVDKNYAQRYHAMTALQADLRTLREAYPDRVWESVLLADFNSEPGNERFAGDPTWSVLEDWVDLWAEHPDVDELHTLPTRSGDPELNFPPALFDRALVQPELREAPWITSLPSVIARGSDTNNIHTKPGNNGHVSDHYPIYITLTRE